MFIFNARETPRSVRWLPEGQRFILEMVVERVAAQGVAEIIAVGHNRGQRAELRGIGMAVVKLCAHLHHFGHAQLGKEQGRISRVILAEAAGEYVTRE